MDHQRTSKVLVLCATEQAVQRVPKLMVQCLHLPMA